MTPERWQQIDRIFHAVLQRDPSQRSAFVAESCAGDPALGDVVAVLHSGITGAQRAAEWQRLASGEARVCIGPRSAVFAPLADLGLIIVDEEHEGSYKNEGDPRYDARTVAERRATQHGAVLLLGSATPRPETMVSATRLSLPVRLSSRGR